MNLLKKTAAGIMVLVILLGVCGCAKRFSLDIVKDIAEVCGLEETGDVDRIAKDIHGRLDYNELVYCYTDKPAKAQRIYDDIYNKSNTYPKVKVKAAAVMYSNVINSDEKAISEYVFVFTFKNSKKAYEFFHDTEEGFKVMDHKEGKDKYEYIILTGHNDQATLLFGAYLDGDTVVIISGSGYKINDCTLIDRFCQKTEIISPETLLK